MLSNREKLRRNTDNVLATLSVAKNDEPISFIVKKKENRCQNMFLTHCNIFSL